MRAASRDPYGDLYTVTGVLFGRLSMAHGQAVTTRTADRLGRASRDEERAMDFVPFARWHAGA
jgi:hypothetical protein